MNSSKIVYKPIGLVGSVLAGAAAGMIFRRVWQAAAGSDTAPRATDERRGWGEILIAAGLQGAIFAVVKAAVDRASATGVRSLTGKWPG
jgi:Protein of unknown function (DUF4235)